MSDIDRLSRRQVVVGAGAAAFAGAMGMAPRRAFAKDLVVGFIYVGPKDDYGYNQPMPKGRPPSRAWPPQAREEEKVAETIDVQKTMESMIELDGAPLLFPTSFGYFDPHVLKMAEKYKNVQFRHCGGLWDKAKHPTNAGLLFRLYRHGQYLNGIAAGHASKTKKLGFVAAKPIPQVLLNINSYTLGARSVDPSITTQVIFTGDWSLAVKEAEATNSLVDAGADVITCHVDGPKVVVETAERRGVFTCGYHANQQKARPQGLSHGRGMELGPPSTRCSPRRR